MHERGELQGGGQGTAIATASHQLDSPESHFNPESQCGKQGDWSKSEAADFQGEEMLFSVLKAGEHVYFCYWGWGMQASPLAANESRRREHNAGMATTTRTLEVCPQKRPTGDVAGKKTGAGGGGQDCSEQR